MNPAPTIRKGLYRDAEGRLVDVCAVHDDRVEFAAQGGGFVRSASLEDFASAFEPAEFAPYRAIQVCAEWLAPQTCLSAYGNDRRWNGWVMPYFDRDQGLRMCAELLTLHFDPLRDAFVWLDTSAPPDEQEQLFPASFIEVDGAPVKVYGIGAGSWTWEEACD